MKKTIVKSKKKHKDKNNSISNNIPVDIFKIKCKKIINQHSDSVFSIILLTDGRIDSSSHDKTIKIFNMKNNYHCDITIFHSESVEIFANWRIKI